MSTKRVGPHIETYWVIKKGPLYFSRFLGWREKQWEASVFMLREMAARMLTKPESGRVVRIVRKPAGAEAGR